LHRGTEMSDDPKLVVKCFYVKNLKMSPEKLAAQVAHAVTRLELPCPPNIVIVLSASKTKFRNVSRELDDQGIPYYIHKDLGLTELPRDTETVLAYLETATQDT
jgi:peptidyl-tRNA hydrolase